MKIAIVGATGRAGKELTAELIRRGHQVTAISRHPEKSLDDPKVTPAAGDVTDKDGLAKVLAGHDVVITTVRFRDCDPATLIGAVQASGVKRYLVVGGAGSLEISNGELLINQPDFPEIARPEATEGLKFLNYLRGITDLDWTFLSPSAYFFEGPRTGTFRIGEDRLLTNDKGSSISFADYAIAMADEIENPKYIRRRFTVGY